MNELEKTVRHLDLLHQFALQAAEKECPGFLKSLTNLTKKLEALRVKARPSASRQ